MNLSACDFGNPIYNSHPYPNGGRIEGKAKIYMTDDEDFVEVPVWVDWTDNEDGTHKVEVHVLGQIPEAAPYAADDLLAAADEALAAAGVPDKPAYPFSIYPQRP